jgi:hypothetical protein
MTPGLEDCQVYGLFGRLYVNCGVIWALLP